MWYLLLLIWPVVWLIFLFIVFIGGLRRKILHLSDKFSFRLWHSRIHWFNNKQWTLLCHIRHDERNHRWDADYSWCVVGTRPTWCLHEYCRWVAVSSKGFRLFQAKRSFVCLCVSVLLSCCLPVRPTMWTLWLSVPNGDDFSESISIVGTQLEEGNNMNKGNLFLIWHYYFFGGVQNELIKYHSKSNLKIASRMVIQDYYKDRKVISRSQLKLFWMTFINHFKIQIGGFLSDFNFGYIDKSKKSLFQIIWKIMKICNTVKSLTAKLVRKLIFRSDILCYHSWCWH